MSLTKCLAYIVAMSAFGCAQSQSQVANFNAQAIASTAAGLLSQIDAVQTSHPEFMKNFAVAGALNVASLESDAASALPDGAINLAGESFTGFKSRFKTMLKSEAIKSLPKTAMINEVKAANLSVSTIDLAEIKMAITASLKVLRNVPDNNALEAASLTKLALFLRAGEQAGFGLDSCPASSPQTGTIRNTSSSTALLDPLTCVGTVAAVYGAYKIAKDYEARVEEVVHDAKAAGRACRKAGKWASEGPNLQPNQNVPTAMDNHWSGSPAPAGAPVQWEGSDDCSY